MPVIRGATGAPDNAHVASGEAFEIGEFARRHGLTPDEVREMVARVGNGRDALEREAARLKRN